MKIKLFFFGAIIFLLVQITSAQTPGFVFSSIRRPVQNKQDSLLLIRNEQKMWVAAKEGKVMMFDNPMMDIRFRVRMSKAGVEDAFKDSLTAKNATANYRMVLMENRNIDSVYTLSFNPFLTYKYQAQGEWVMDPDTSTQIRSGIVTISRHRLPGPWVTGNSIRFWIPLCDYPSVLPANNITRLKSIHQNQISTLLSGKISGDTILRTVRFTCDSNEYLPQAPYADFLTSFKNYLFAGEIHGFNNEQLEKAMAKYQIESAFVNWDSTNQVANPNTPGVFIIAPIKSEGQVKSLLIYEKWISFTPPLSPYNYNPRAFTGYRRVVCAYGLYLTNGYTIWLSPVEVNNALLKSNFDIKPYEECFRAERFKTLQVQLQK